MTRFKKVVVLRDNLDFSDAFSTAREVSANEFEWRGRRYHTKTREELGLLPVTNPKIIRTRFEPWNSTGERPPLK